MPSRLPGYIEKLFLLRIIYTYTLHIYTTIKIYRIHRPHRPIKIYRIHLPHRPILNSSNVSASVSPVSTSFSNSLLENTCNNTVNLEILLV